MPTPEEIARKVVNDWTYNRMLWSADLVTDIAAALTTEREAGLRAVEAMQEAAAKKAYMMQGHGRIADAIRGLPLPTPAPRSTGHVEIAHDGFTGDIIGHYVTREGKRGVVVQQDGTRVVHIYGEKWLTTTPDDGAGAWPTLSPCPSLNRRPEDAPQG